MRATGRNEAMGKLLQKMGAEFVHADLTELVLSGQVMLAGIDTLWLPFTSPWGTRRLLISLTCAPRTSSGRMGRRLGRA